MEMVIRALCLQGSGVCLVWLCCFEPDMRRHVLEGQTISFRPGSKSEEEAKAVLPLQRHTLSQSKDPQSGLLSEVLNFPTAPAWTQTFNTQVFGGTLQFCT